jgi:hypothetical protein
LQFETTQKSKKKNSINLATKMKQIISNFMRITKLKNREYFWTINKKESQSIVTVNKKEALINNFLL